MGTVIHNPAYWVVSTIVVVVIIAVCLWGAKRFGTPKPPKE